MKKFISGLCLGVFALLASSAGSAATVNVVASNANPKVGEPFSVMVSGTGFSETFGATLGLTFNSKVLSVSSVVLAPGSPFTVGVTAKLPFHSGDPFTVVGPMTGALPAGNFDIVQINFTVLAPGKSDITLVDNGADKLWLDGAEKRITVTYNQAHVQVAAPAGKRHRHGAAHPTHASEQRT